MTDARGLRDRLERLQREAAAIERDIERIEKRPAEPTGDGTVIRFSLLMPVSSMHNGTKRYDFAALRTNRRWFTTGKSGPANGRRWDELLDYIERHTLVDDLIEVWNPLEDITRNGAGEVVIISGGETSYLRYES